MPVGRDQGLGDRRAERAARRRSTRHAQHAAPRANRAQRTGVRAELTSGLRGYLGYGAEHDGARRQCLSIGWEPASTQESWP